MFRKLKEYKARNNLRFFTYSIYGILIFIICLFFIGLFSNIITNNGKTDETFLFNKRPTVIITGSMQPIIKVNSIVMLEPAIYSDLEVGDIIRYDSNNGYSILHRIVYKTPTYVVTKGDANNSNDAFPVTAEQITGRVVDIHNEFSDIITLIFGTFEYDNVEGSIIRALFGFICLAFLLFLIITCFILFFELISITYFFKKYCNDLVRSSSYWLQDVVELDEQINIVNSYNDIFHQVGLVKKIILAYKFRRYYNGLCNVEKEVLKTNKRLKSLYKNLK